MSRPDHFSRQAAEYSLYRPSYPDALFQHLFNLCARTDWAWDCATGSGQAATGLARYFKNVIATDRSAAQIEQAQVVQNIDYRVASAERSGIDPACLDFILVAQALHWFDFGAFYREAKRVLKSDGVLAVVAYQLPRINTDINAVIDVFHSDIIGGYWPPERSHVDNGYRDIPFPLQEITPPSMQMEHDWTLDQFLGYLRSWSAAVYFEKERKQNPVEIFRKKLLALWPDESTVKHIVWPLILRIGKFPGH